MDAVEVILGVGLGAGIPRDFFAEYNFAVNHRCALTIAGTEVKADAMTLEMAAEGSGGFALLRRTVVCGGDDLHRTAVDSLAHEFVVERAGTATGIDGAEPRREGVIASYGDAVSALLP